MLLLNIAIVVTMAALTSSDPASDQLVNYKRKTKGCIEILTTSNGAQVEVGDINTLDTQELMENEYLMESLSHKIQSKIPERVVHTKGNGAHGYFKVTHNISDICRASVFAYDGKITPTFVRFSVGRNARGESDTQLGARGFAVKFYTDEGNFDFVGFHTPLFIFKEPSIFLFFNQASGRNPETNFRDSTTFWDYISMTPEVVPFFMYLHGDDGIPDGFRFMPGFSCHTYQVYNEYGKSYFVRFHFLPDGGIKNMYLDDAKRAGCMDPDYAGRDLYNAIANGNYPSWTLKVQVLTLEDVKKSKFDPFDITKSLSEDLYPLRTVGTLVLNRNPTNHFADVEQAAFCPGNLVRGILGGPDKAFIARRFAYKAAQRYRLGSNFHNIKINQPIPKIVTYDRDGNPPVVDNGGTPSYFLNSFNGPIPYVDKNKPKLIKIKQYADPYNFEEASERYNKLTQEQRQRLVGNIMDTLKRASTCVQDRMIAIFRLVHLDLAFRIVNALSKTRKESN